VIAAALLLAIVLVTALQQGALWVGAVCAGGIAGLVLRVATRARIRHPWLSAALVGGAAVPVLLLWLMSGAAGLGTVAAASAVYVGARMIREPEARRVV